MSHNDPIPDTTATGMSRNDENDAPEDDGPECDLCGETTCPDADLPEFSEPQACVLRPVYDELRYDRCDYGCGRDITKASVRIAVRTLASLRTPPEENGSDVIDCTCPDGRYDLHVAGGCSWTSPPGMTQAGDADA